MRCVWPGCTSLAYTRFLSRLTVAAAAAVVIGVVCGRGCSEGSCAAVDGGEAGGPHPDRGCHPPSLGDRAEHAATQAAAQPRQPDADLRQDEAVQARGERGEHRLGMELPCGQITHPLTRALTRQVRKIRSEEVVDNMAAKGMVPAATAHM